METHRFRVSPVFRTALHVKRLDLRWEPTQENWFVDLVRHFPLRRLWNILQWYRKTIVVAIVAGVNGTRIIIHEVLNLEWLHQHSFHSTLTGWMEEIQGMKGLMCLVQFQLKPWIDFEKNSAEKTGPERGHASGAGQHASKESGLSLIRSIIANKLRLRDGWRTILHQTVEYHSTKSCWKLEQFSLRSVDSFSPQFRSWIRYSRIQTTDQHYRSGITVRDFTMWLW